MGHWQCCWVYQCPKNLHHSYQLMIGWSRRRKEFKQYQETAQWEHLEIANITVMTLTLITIFIATQNHKQLCLYDFFAWSSVYSAYKRRGSCNLLFQTWGSWLTYNKLQMLFSDMSCWITVHVHANAKLVKPATMTIHVMLHPHTANHLSQLENWAKRKTKWHTFDLSFCMRRKVLSKRLSKFCQCNLQQTASS